MTGGTVDKLLVEEQRDLLRHLADNVVYDIEAAVVDKLSGNQHQRAYQIPGERNTLELARRSLQLGKLLRISAGNVLLAAVVVGNVDSAAYNVLCGKLVNRGYLVHLVDDLVDNGRRDNRAVVGLSPVCACSDLNSLAAQIFLKHTVFVSGSLLRFVCGG